MGIAGPSSLGAASMAELCLRLRALLHSRPPLRNVHLWGGATSDENLDGSLKFFVDVEGVKVPYELKSCVM